MLGQNGIVVGAGNLKGVKERGDFNGCVSWLNDSPGEICSKMQIVRICTGER